MEKDVRNDQDQDQVSDQKQDDMVKYETHRKLLGQHKRTQEEKAELAARIAELEDAENTRNEEKLVQQGELKKIIELREAKLQKYETEVEAERKLRVEAENKNSQTWKLQSFYSKLPGKIKRADYLSHVDLESIVYDPETMSCDEDSVQAVVNKFMEDHSDLVIPTSAPKLPSKAADTRMNINDIGKEKPTAQQLIRDSLKILV